VRADAAYRAFDDVERGAFDGEPGHIHDVDHAGGRCGIRVLIERAPRIETAR